MIFVFQTYFTRSKYDTRTLHDVVIVPLTYFDTVAQCLAEIILLAHPLHQTVYPHRVPASLQCGPRHELGHILRDLRQLGLLRDHILHRRHPVQDLPALLRVPVGDRNFQHDQRLLHTASTDASDLRYAHAPRQENPDRFDLWTLSLIHI